MKRAAVFPWAAYSKDADSDVDRDSANLSTDSGRPLNQGLLNNTPEVEEYDLSRTRLIQTPSPRVKRQWEEEDRYGASPVPETNTVSWRAVNAAEPNIQKRKVLESIPLRKRQRLMEGWARIKDINSKVGED
jgi:hypothetical protein